SPCTGGRDGTARTGKITPLGSYVKPVYLFSVEPKGWAGAPYRLYDSATKQAWKGSPTTATGRRVLAGVFRRQVRCSPHLHGLRRAGRDQHLVGQPGANRQNAGSDGW